MFERETIDLSGFWYFKTDPKGKGEAERWFEEERLTGWDRLYVPCPWNEQDSAYTWYIGTAWYSRSFYIPKDWNGKAVSMFFEGVNYRAKVWVNKTLLGEHEGGFTPFCFRIEDKLGFGCDNRVFVMVDNTLTKKTIPPGEGMNRTYFDFFHYGGIYREAYLVATSKTYVNDVTLKTDIEDRRGIVNASVSVVNETDESRSYQLILKVFDSDEALIEDSETIFLEASSSKIVEKKIVIDNAKLWCREPASLQACDNHSLRRRRNRRG